MCWCHRGVGGIGVGETAIVDEVQRSTQGGAVNVVVLGQDIARGPASESGSPPTR